MATVSQCQNALGQISRTMDGIRPGENATNVRVLAKKSGRSSGINPDGINAKSFPSGGRNGD